MFQEPATHSRTPRLVGGAPCLDFVNTVGYRGREDGRDERLPDYAGLIAWAERVGIRGGAVSHINSTSSGVSP